MISNAANVARLVATLQAVIAATVCKTAVRAGAYLTVEEEEDLISAVNLRAIQALSGTRAKFDARRGLDMAPGYVRAIARNMTVDHLRARKDVVPMPMGMRSALTADMAVMAQDYEKTVARTVAKGRQGMTVRERQVLAGIQSGQTVAEIAAALGVSAVAVRTAKCRALKALKATAA